VTSGLDAPDYDVAIIGAGPAGSATAIAYKQAAPDLRIALVDKSTFPRDKACGDGLGPGAVRVLAELGVSAILDGQKRVNTVEVRGPVANMAHGALPTLDAKAKSGVVIKRLDFDDRLHAAALALGVDDLTGRRFIGSELRDDRRLVGLSHDGTPSTISVSLLVGADGAASRVRASLGVQRNADRLTGIGIRAYGRVLAPGGQPPDTLLLDYAEHLIPGYGWVFPLGDGSSNVGVFMIVSALKERGLKARQLLDGFIGHLEARGYRVSDVSSERTYILPHAAGMPKLAHPRAALIGDAASMINPWSGEGIFYGMEAGRILAAATVHDLLGSNGNIAESLRLFERRFRRRFSWHFKSCYLAHRITRSRRMSAGILRVAAHDKEVFDYFVSLMFGETGVDPGMVARILWRIITPNIRHEPGHRPEA
jgi:geranylgeranyl reductase family protein